MLPALEAPVFELHAPVPAVPVIVQTRFPIGATPPVAPVTVAVTVSLVPRTGDAGMLVRTTVGVAGETTVVVEEEVRTTGMYEVSPAKMKLAPYVPVTDATRLHV